MTCNKCRQAARHASDSWCLACSAWEQLGAELALTWATPGARLLAQDLVVSAVRQVRAVRRLGHVGGSRPASSGLKEEAPEVRRKPSGSEKPPEPPGPPPGLKAAPKVKAHSEREAEEEEEEYTESEEAASPEVRSERRPLSRGRGREEQKGGRVVREEKSSEAAPADRSRSRQGHRARSRRGERRHQRTRRKDHRGGRNHARLYRAEADPYRVLHHRKPGSFWDRGLEEPSKSDLVAPPNL